MILSIRLRTSRKLIEPVQRMFDSENSENVNKIDFLLNSEFQIQECTISKKFIQKTLANLNNFHQVT